MAKKHQIIFHAFTDEKDRYFETYPDAVKCVKDWRKEGYENLRIWSQADDGEDIEDVDCLYAEGDFPR